jgi:hypothetical protein
MELFNNEIAFSSCIMVKFDREYCNFWKHFHPYLLLKSSNEKYPLCCDIPGMDPEVPGCEF